jgi:pyruvate dehydrogenase (quinone)
VIDRAFRAALAARQPTVVILPHDVQQEPAPEIPHEHGKILTAPRWSPPQVLPDEADLHRAAEVLNSGSKVALLVGQGARRAQQEVVAVAEKLGAGIATSLLGKPYVDENLPFAAGTMGHLGTTASAHLLGNCDTLLIVGSNDPWTEFYPPPGAARAVQVDIDPAAIGNRYPVEAGLTGDAAATLQRLLPLLESPADTSWRTEVEEQVRRWHLLRERRAGVPARPVNPELAIRELDGRLPEDALLAVDVGSIVYWYARQLRLPDNVPAHLSGTLASMGCSVPYAIAAKLAQPQRPAVVLSGDGAMQMSGLSELVTVSRMWKQWQDPRFVVCVLNNRELAEVTWEQREMEGEPRFEDSQALPDFNYADYARVLGVDGMRVEDPAQLGEAWDRALAAQRPFILEVLTDPDTPLLPPFPAGAQKAESMRQGLAAEGSPAEHARGLLDKYVALEEELQGGSWQHGS